MKQNILLLLLAFVLVSIYNPAVAQVYRASETSALQNNGIEWIQKKLPPSLITFSDYSGQIEIKAALSSLFIQDPDSTSIIQSSADTLAVFNMKLDPEQIKQQQVTAGKTFNTNGTLVINGSSKIVSAQCQLIPRNNIGDGFNIAVVLRFNPADFGLKMIGETENDPLIVRVNAGYVNNRQNNF